MRRLLSFLLVLPFLAACTGSVTSSVEQEPAPLDTAADPGLVLQEPAGGATVTSPVTIRGEARASWYTDEAVTVRISDRDGNVIAVGHASAEGEILPDVLTPFSGVVDFETDQELGLLSVQKTPVTDNPEEAAGIVIPVRFAR